MLPLNVVANHFRSSYYLLIDFLAPPNITHISHNETANERDKVILNCTADGNPPPNITWTRLASNSHVTFPLAVSRHDEGGYRCTADNGFGAKIRDVFNTVQCEYDYLFHDAWRFGMGYGLSSKSS